MGKKKQPDQGEIETAQRWKDVLSLGGSAEEIAGKIGTSRYMKPLEQKAYEYLIQVNLENPGALENAKRVYGEIRSQYSLIRDDRNKRRTKGERRVRVDLRTEAKSEETMVIATNPEKQKPEQKSSSLTVDKVPIPAGVTHETISKKPKDEYSATMREIEKRTANLVMTVYNVRSLSSPDYFSKTVFDPVSRDFDIARQRISKIDSEALNKFEVSFIGQELGENVAQDLAEAFKKSPPTFRGVVEDVKKLQTYRTNEPPKEYPMKNAKEALDRIKGPSSEMYNQILDDLNRQNLYETYEKIQLQLHSIGRKLDKFTEASAEVLAYQLINSSLKEVSLHLHQLRRRILENNAKPFETLLTGSYLLAMKDSGPVEIGKLRQVLDEMGVEGKNKKVESFSNAEEIYVKFDLGGETFSNVDLRIQGQKVDIPQEAYRGLAVLDVLETHRRITGGKYG